MQRAKPATEPTVASREEAPAGTAPDETEPPGQVELPLDVVFDLLANERRRQVLRYLKHEADPTTLSDLAEHIAAIENDKPERELSSSERKRVYICLYQCHLPKLDDADVIDFDEHRKTVTAGPTMETVLENLPDSTPDESVAPLAQYTLALTAIGGAAFAVGAAVAPVGWVMGLTLGFLLVSVTFAAHWNLGRGDVPELDRWAVAVRPS